MLGFYKVLGRKGTWGGPYMTQVCLVTMTEMLGV